MKFGWVRLKRKTQKMEIFIYISSRKGRNESISDLLDFPDVLGLLAKQVGIRVSHAMGGCLLLATIF
jgi:hypothetical protein